MSHPDAVLCIIYFCDWVGLLWCFSKSVDWNECCSGFGGLVETVAVPSLQATQLRLKRARLADDLNEKIAQRPGPLELVEKNILPVDSSVKEAIIGENANYINVLNWGKYSRGT